MIRTLTAVAAAALAATLVLPASDANAQYYYRRGPSGGAVAAGVLGGLAAGAIIGGAIASSRPSYGEPVYVAPPPPPPPPYAGYAPVAGWAPYPAYAGAVPVGCPGGYWARRPIYGPYGEFAGYSRPRYFCP